MDFQKLFSIFERPGGYFIMADELLYGFIPKAKYADWIQKLANEGYAQMPKYKVFCKTGF